MRVRVTEDGVAGFQVALQGVAGFQVARVWVEDAPRGYTEQQDVA